MKKKILVTGGAGFIGQQVLPLLCNKGDTVIAPSFAELDLLNRLAVKNFMQQHQFTDLIHLAWYVGKGLHTHNDNLEWLSVSLDMLRWFKENNGKRCLVAGSVSEYDFSCGYLKEEATPLTNHSLYGKAKTALDTVGYQYAKQNDIDFKVARIFNLYGPFEKPARLMPSVILSCLKNEEVKVSTCDKYVDYLHVYDTARAIVTLFESEITGAVNIASGEAIYLKTIVEKIHQFTNSQSKILWGAIPPSYDDPFICGDNTKLKALGWKPQFTLDEGLKNTIEWWRNNIGNI